MRQWQEAQEVLRPAGSGGLAVRRRPKAWVARRCWPLLLVLTACGGGTAPLAGDWQCRQLPGGGSLKLMFDRDSDRVTACRLQADGTDTDLHGTFRLQDGTVRIDGVWDDGVAAIWTGRLDAEGLQLRIDDQPLSFERLAQ